MLSQFRRRFWISAATAGLVFGMLGTLQSEPGIIATAAHAKENTPLKCRTGRARSAPSATGPALVANVPRSMTPITLNAVLFTDKQLGKEVIIEEVQAMRTETDNLSIFVRLVNCTKRPMAVQARTNFLKANQAPSERPSAWKTIFLSPLSTSGYEENSFSGLDGAAFYVELRPNT